MARTIHALLLIVSLLTCPFWCLGSVGVACASTEQSASCSCCKHREPASQPMSETGPVQQEQVPSAPGGECQCSNCLCQGAVLTDDDAVQDVLASFAGLPVADIWSPTAALAAGDQTAGLAEGPPLSASTAGRPLRLVLQSLQI